MSNRDSFFSGRSFASLVEMRAEAARWSRVVAGGRSCRPLGGASPLSLFEAKEREQLLSLPPSAFEPATWQEAKVAPDSHISVGGALYSVPWKFIGRRISVRMTDTMIFCYLDQELVKSHVRLAKGRRATDWQDYPPEKTAFFMRTPSWCRRKAEELGPAVMIVVGELLGVQVLHRLRAAQGIITLADTYGSERLNAACRLAVEVGDPGYHTIRGILRAGRECLVAEEELTLLTPAHLHDPDTPFAHLKVT